jgi:hypothetical protein
MALGGPSRLPTTSMMSGISISRDCIADAPLRDDCAFRRHRVHHAIRARVAPGGHTGSVASGPARRD